MNRKKLSRYFWILGFCVILSKFVLFPVVGAWINSVDESIVVPILERQGIKKIFLALCLSPLAWGFDSFALMLIWNNIKKKSNKVG